jgi:hypothetical protein
MDIAAHRGGSSENALLEVAANIEIDSLFCSSPNLQARRPRFECEADVDHDSDSDSECHRNRRHRNPNVTIDASAEEVNFIAIEVTTKARKTTGSWVTVGTDTLVVDPVFAMNGLSLESIPLASGQVKRTHYDRIKVELDGVAVHYRSNRPSQTFRPQVSSTKRARFQVGSSGASVNVDLHLSVRFADDSDSDQIAFWFEH